MAEPLKGFFDNLQLVIKQLDDGDAREISSLDAVTYWHNLESVLKVLSHECTKLSIACNKPPYPDAQVKEEIMNVLDTVIEKFVSGIERAVLALVSAFYALPKCAGTTLWEQTQGSVRSVIVAVRRLVQSILAGCYQQKSDIDSDSQGFSLVHTGTVWDICDGFGDWPKDNRAASLHRLKHVYVLVSDALQELEEAQSSDGGEWAELNAALNSETGDNEQADVTWSDDDRLLLAPALGLLKVTKKAMKNISGMVKASDSEKTETGSYDVIVSACAAVSPAVDDFAASLYPPVDRQAVSTQSAAMRAVLLTLLTTVQTSSLRTDNDSKWTEFLHKATEHNADKLHQLLQTS